MMKLRAWILLVVGGLGLLYGIYYFLIIIPRTRHINEMMNVAFNAVGHYALVGVVLIVSVVLLKVGWMRLRR